MAKTFSPKWKFNGPIMPKWLLKRKDVSQGAKILYSLMASYAYDGSDHCWPSQVTLAEGMGASLRSIQNYMRELEALGLILTQKEHSGTSRKYYFLQSSMVELHSSSPSNTNATSSQPYANSAGEVRKVCVPKYYNKYKYNTPPLPPKQTAHPVLSLSSSPRGGGFSSAQESAEKAFAKIWEVWPRQEAKIFAQKEWNRLWFSGQLPPLEDLLQRIKYLQDNDRSWLRGYVPYLVNWLKAERWQDPLAPSQQTAPPAESKIYTPEEREAELRRFREQCRASNVVSILQPCNRELHHGA